MFCLRNSMTENISGFDTVTFSNCLRDTLRLVTSPEVPFPLKLDRLQEPQMLHIASPWSQTSAIFMRAL